MSHRKGRYRMQIMIDVSADLYTRLFDNGVDLSDADKETLETAVRKGTVLPENHGRVRYIKCEVLDKIRAEIEAIIGENNLDDYDFCSGLICARKIIDKYKAESEDKE